MYSYDRRADLSPPLGEPGGPCHVVRRIDQEVNNPRLKEQLIDKAEHGDKITNPEAAKIYDVKAERGKGLIQRLLIGPHAQYRMDLRGVTVPQLQAALATFGKLLNDWKSQKNPRYTSYAQKIQQGDPIEFTDPRLSLTVVFVLQGRDAKLVTTYWKGVPDPPPPRHCEIPKHSYDRRAGLFMAPPAMVEKIGIWMRSVYASHVLSIVLPEVEELRERRDDLKTVFVERLRLIKELQQYTSKPKHYRNKATAKFRLDLTGWKYLSPEEIEKHSDWLESYVVTVELNFKSTRSVLGLWRNGRLQVSMPSTPRGVETWKTVLAGLQDTLIHELGHLGQDVLTVTKPSGADGRGLPSSDLRDLSYMPSGHRMPEPSVPWNPRKRLEHPLRDMEFYPNLGDAVNEFKRLVIKLKPEDRADAARIWVGEKPVDHRGPALNEWRQRVPRQLWNTNYNFGALRNQAPAKWQKAVKEFYKAVSL